ncbi:tetratricopeptide repeat protein [Fundidesulfovibrio soli]|uniref:tetratricopeptide repeat protein n=1 Tax=Fundidesulfovibrio soli TaxID=2922716 RepID=UPI001FB01263|nr:tetratricopeptide repeat protein [Fundidesulfovibrio soli]
MTTRSSIGSSERPRDMFSSILRPLAQAQTEGCGCGGGCRAKAMTRLNREGMEACQAGDFAGADRMLTQAIGMARKAGVAMYEAKMRNNLGLVHLLASRPDEARREFGAALDLVAGKLGRENQLYKKIEGNMSRTQAA